jgi:hypothetical protein
MIKKPKKTATKTYVYICPNIKCVVRTTAFFSLYAAGSARIDILRYISIKVYSFKAISWQGVGIVKD